MDSFSPIDGIEGIPSRLSPQVPQPSTHILRIPGNRCPDSVITLSLRQEPITEISQRIRALKHQIQQGHRRSPIDCATNLCTGTHPHPIRELPLIHL
jgi:hypothetical protein